MPLRSIASLFTSIALAAPGGAGVLTLIADRDQSLFESPTGCCSSGAGGYLFAGDRSGGEVNRILLHFDVAGAIPAGSTITDVRLDLTLSRSRAGDEVMTLHRVLQAWGEGSSVGTLPGPGGTAGQGVAAAAGDATWIHAFAPNSLWNTPGGDFDAVPSASLLMGGAAGLGVQSFTSATMAADVQSWLDDDASNFGWLLRAEDEAGGRSARRFDSRESALPGVAPRIEIQYTGPIGSNYCVASTNSTGAGATISAAGCTLASQAALSLHAEDVPPGVPGLFFFSASQVQTPLGDGFLCLGGTTLSLYPPARANAAGSAQRDVDFSLPAAASIVSGADLNFQFWYRDRAALGTGHNLSDGLNVIFQ